MDYKDVNELINNLKEYDKKEASRQLCLFFVNNRFADSRFNDHFIDQSHDGGIDYFFGQNKTFYILQSKFNSENSEVSLNNIKSEIDKIINTVDNKFTDKLKNDFAKEFIAKIRNNLNNSVFRLNIYYLTTGKISNEKLEDAKKYLLERVKDKSWNIRFTLLAFDSPSLERMILNKKFGFVPYTGEKEINIEDKKYLEVSLAHIESIVCSIRISQIIDWFKSKEEIKLFLQKNIRGYLGDKKYKGINKRIKESYLEDPDHFWFKHNGIIIFVDDYDLKQDSTLLLTNPQIVNGGQTINAIHSAYSQSGKKNNSKVLLRIIKMPYDSRESYEKGLEIIEGLNSQNKITAVDLRSNDECQVQIQRLIERISKKYIYFRKKEEGVVAGDKNVIVDQLANLINCCDFYKPNEAIRAEYEKLFQKDKYNLLFNKNKLFVEFDKNLEVYKYLIIWRLSRIITKVNKNLRIRDQNIFYLSKFYVLADVYSKLKEFRNIIRYNEKLWFEFIESDYFKNGITTYSKIIFPRAYDLIPKKEKNAPDKFFKNSSTVNVARERLGLKQEFNRILNTKFKEFEKNEININY